MKPGTGMKSGTILNLLMMMAAPAQGMVTSARNMDQMDVPHRPSHIEQRKLKIGPSKNFFDALIPLSPQ